MVRTAVCRKANSFALPCCVTVTECEWLSQTANLGSNPSIINQFCFSEGYLLICDLSTRVKTGKLKAVSKEVKNSDSRGGSLNLTPNKWNIGNNMRDKKKSGYTGVVKNATMLLIIASPFIISFVVGTGYLIWWIAKFAVH